MDVHKVFNILSYRTIYWAVFIDLCQLKKCLHTLTEHFENSEKQILKESKKIIQNNPIISCKSCKKSCKNPGFGIII